MANPVLIAKLVLVAADPKTWQKIIIACISIFIISAALLGSCGAMTFTDLGFKFTLHGRLFYVRTMPHKVV